MSSKNTGKFLLAGLVGAVAGAVGGLLFAPKSGKETREDIAKLAKEISRKVKTEAEETEERVREVFGNASKAAVDKYKEVRAAVVNKVAEIKTAGSEIDKEKYSEIVEDVLGGFKSDFVATKNGATKMASQMKKDWEKIKKALA